MARHGRKSSIPVSLSVLYSPEDFAQMAAICPIGFKNHTAYLRKLALTLAALRKVQAEVMLTPFDPSDYLEFCLELQMDPAMAESRAAYTTEPRILPPLLYTGEPLPLILQALALLRSDEQTILTIEDLLRDEATTPAELARLCERSADYASAVFAALITGAGQGLHLVTIVMADLKARAGIWIDNDVIEVIRPAPDAFCDLLGAAHVLSEPAAIVLRSVPSTGHNARAGLRGWRLTPTALIPLTAAELKLACTTHSETGAPVPPEDNVIYEAAYPLPPP